MKLCKAMCLAFVMISFSGIASAETLVSNLGLTTSSVYECNYGNWWASPFVTDSQEWYLVSVTLRVVPIQMDSSNPIAFIFADNGSSHPSSTRVASLNSPAFSIGVEGDYTFTASAPIQLIPNTRYYVALGSDTGNQRIEWHRTTSSAHTGVGDKPFLAYIDTGHDFDWNYTRDYYTMVFQVEVEPPTISTEENSWGAIKSLYSE